MKHLLKSALVSTTAFTALMSAHALAEDVDITFLLVADIYEMGDGWDRGGFSRAAAVARAERAKGGNLLYIHAGDTISPSLFSGFDQGEHVIDLLNMEAPDIFVPGNHEFDFGPEIFVSRMNDLNSTKLAANLRDENDGVIDGFADTKMYEFGPVKVGVVGLTAEDAPVKSSPGDLKISGSVATLETQASALRDAGADIIVAVTHSDLRVDADLINSGAADIILSGDDHFLRISDTGSVAFAEPASDAMNMVAVDVTVTVEVDGNDRDVEWHNNFRVIDTAAYDVPDDYATKVAALQAELDRELDVAVGTVVTPLDSRRQSVRTSETAIGNLITDAMRDAVGADIAITNGGGIRADKQYDPNHQLTRKDVLTELPFGNVTIMVELSGADVIAALENGLQSFPDATGRFPQVSGLEVVFDPANPAGERVISVMVDGTAIDPAASYKVATNDYMGRGGDGYTMFVGKPVLFSLTDAKLMANDVMAYVRKNGTVSPSIEGRTTTK